MSDYYAEPPLFAAARRTDPPTSHAAIAARTGLTIAQVSKRLGELRRAGLIERDGETRSASGGREARYRRTA